STFFLVKTNSLEGLPQRLHLYNIYYHLGLQEVTEITQTSPLPLQIIPARNPIKKTQETSLELNPRFLFFLSLVCCVIEL
ncbi:hypothetical protein GIB67_037139, partial [Kingdonia uniflora]